MRLDVIRGTLRSSSCKRAADKGTFLDGICSNCRQIKSSSSFRNRFHRISQRNEESAKSNRFCDIPNNELINTCRKLKQKIKEQNSEIFFCRSKIASLTSRGISLQEKISQLCKEGGFGSAII